MLRRLLAPGAGLLLLALAACQETSYVAPPELGKDYYPLKVGTVRVFNVEDVSYRNNVPTTVTSQLREEVKATYQDAAGNLTYQVLRSSRRRPTDDWRADSVQTLTVNPNNLLLTRSNLRTVELIFPVREGAAWNRNAFNNRDTIVAVNRRYQEVGQGQTIGGRLYANTVTAFDEGDDPGFIIYRRTQRNVYAQGIGPVLRELINYNYCQDSRNCSVGTGYIVSGTRRVETLAQ